MNKVDEVMKLLHAMEEHKINADNFTHSIIFYALCCKRNRMEIALKMFKDLLKKCVTFNFVVYNTMINGFCLRNLTNDALKLISKMKENGCNLDAVTYETTIHSLFNNNEDEKAEKLLCEMISNGLL